MSRGRFNDERGRGSPRGGRAGRGRGRGRGGFSPSEVQHEAVEIMAELGIPYRGARDNFRGGRGFPSGGRGSPNNNYSPRGRGSQTPNYYSPRGRGSQTPNGRGWQTPPNGRGRARGSGIGFRQEFDHSAQPPWERGGIGRVAAAVGDRKDRPLLKPVKFVKSGVLFEDKDDIFKAETVDVEEDPEKNVEWLDKTFERAVAVAVATEHDQGIDTPGELAIENVLMQATRPGILLAHERTVIRDSSLAAPTELAISTASISMHSAAVRNDQPLSPPPVLADKAAETDEDEEQIVFIPVVARSHLASKGPSPLPPPETDDVQPTQAVPDQAIEDSPALAAKEHVAAEEQSAPVLVSVIEADASVPCTTPAVPPPRPQQAESSAPALPRASSPIIVVSTIESFSLSPGFDVSPKKKSLARKEIKRQRRAERRKRSLMELGISPRIGDSDLDWGSDGPPEVGPDGVVVGDDAAASDGEDALSDAIGAMEIDDMDPVALQRFVEGLHAPEVTIDDLEDGEKLRKEDDEEEDSGDWTTESEGEEEREDTVEAALRKGERELLGESDDEEDSSDEEDADEDEEETTNQAGPSGGFQARLDRAKAAARANAKKKGKSKMNYDEEEASDDGDEALFNGKFSWADQDEKFLADMQDILDENADILEGRDRRTKKKLFNAIRDGNFQNAIEADDLLFASKMVKKGKKKRDDIPVELQGQWDKDRAKKADYKRERALARKKAELDPFRSSKGKNKNKKDRKRGKSNPDETDSDDSDITEPLVPITDMLSLEKNIRVFLQDLGKTTMVLPAMDKESRRRAHLLAECFSIKSQSKGKGVARFPVFMKTSRSGVNVDERKVQKIVLADKEAGATSGQGAFYKAYYSVKVDSKSGAKGTREGDIVGAKAAKIDDSNVGYKMLQLMGWAEGDRIGKTGGGIIDPLTAVIKRTKLGLGAAR